MSTLTVRKLDVDLSLPFGRHWAGGDAYRTQLLNALSMTFPLGEQSFIDSIRAIAPERLADPALRAEVRDFIGQEASHRFVHVQYNARLAEQGLVLVREKSIARRMPTPSVPPASARCHNAAGPSGHEPRAVSADQHAHQGVCNDQSTRQQERNQERAGQDHEGKEGSEKGQEGRALAPVSAGSRIHQCAS